ncbi:hypothetical protein Tco_0196106 [Tanacetum coccineum]
MDPNTSIRRLCLREDNRISLNDGVESNGEWDAPEYNDTTDSRQKKEAKAFTFYHMETEEISERYVAPFKLCLEHEVKNGDKVVKKELIVALRGEIYFVKFIINPEEDDIKPGVVLGRSFLRLTKGISDFGNEIITIYPELDPLLDNSNKSDDSGDDWEVILEDIDFDDIPQLEGIDVPPYVCKMGKSSRNKKKPCKNYEMTYSNEGPSLTVKQPLTQEGMDREALKKDMYERILILQEPRPIIETIKFIDQHKKLLDIFILPIRLEAKIDSFALADTGSNINVLPYHLYTKLGREEAKPVGKKITMLDYSKAEPMGILRYVVCQVEVTTILAKFLILDIPVDKDVPIVIGRSFLYTCGGIINTIKGITSTFDGIYHQRFYVAAVKNIQEEKDSEEEEEYYVKRDKNGSLLVPLQHMEWISSYSDSFSKKGRGDGKWHTKIRVVDPYGNVFDQGCETKATGRKLSRAAKTRYNTNLARLLPKQIYSPVIVDWGVLNNIGCVKEIKAMLEIKLYEIGGQEEIFRSKAWRRAFDINELIYTELCHEFYSTYEFDEVVMDDELITKKVFKFGLGGQGHTLTLLEFARRLSLYHAAEINEKGFEVYFRGGLRSDENFNARDYWLSISSEEELHLSRSLASTIRTKHQNGYVNVAWLMAKWLKRKGVRSQRESMIYCGQLITKLAKRMGLLTDEVLNSLSALTYCRALDMTTLRELINPNGKLITEDPTPRVPRVAMPKGQRPSMHDLYDRMGRMEIRQEELKRMSRRQSYHSDRYARVYEHMAGHYGYTLQGAYAPPSYVEEQPHEDED